MNDWSVSKREDNIKGGYVYSVNGWTNDVISPDQEEAANNISHAMTCWMQTHPLIVACRVLMSALTCAETDECVNLNLGIHDEHISFAWRELMKESAKIPLLRDSFTAEALEIAFGEDADGYEDSEVLEKLREFSTKAFLSVEILACLRNLVERDLIKDKDGDHFAEINYLLGCAK